MNVNSLKAPIRIGIDTGGTFTDYVIVSSTGEIYAWKVPTTPTDPSIGIIEGLREVMETFHFQAGDVDLIVHGTTIGTNAFLEDKCPPVAFVTTKGFQDIVEIGRQQRSELYNFKFGEKYPISFSKDILFEVDERLDRDGKVIRQLDMSNLDALVSELKTNSIQTVAVSLLFSFLNPQNEKSISS
ncbi:MAG: hydantoinase/oxoprolinase N-terminal domain-containing protein, partial [Candidatus Heimdallarchaeaceae archaeon]